MDETRSTGEIPDENAPVRRTLRRRLLSAARWFAVAIVVAVLIGAIALPIILNSSRFHSYLIATAQRMAEEKLGVPVRISNFALHLSTLSLDLYGLTVSGANAHPNPPLLEVQHIQAGIKVVSFLRKKWYLNTLRIDRPVIRIYVDAQGSSNIPTPKGSGGSNTTIFDLGIRHSVIDGGVVYFNDEPRNLAADVHDVDLDAAFNELLKRYSGTLGYTEGKITFGSINPPAHSFNVSFDADPATLHLAPAKLTIGKSQLTLNATLGHYDSPEAQAQYNLSADGAQIAQALHSRSIPSGLIVASGSLKYKQDPNRTFLESLQIDGDLQSSRLDVRTARSRTAVVNLRARYSLANGDAALRDLRARILGGELTAQGAMRNIGGDSRSQLNAALRGASIAELRRAFAHTDAAGVALSGTLTTIATASWGRTLDDLVARADATISGQASGALAPREETAVQNAVPASSALIPLHGDFHVTYTARDQKLAVAKSTLATPKTTVAMNGVLSRTSNLDMQLEANDLREVEAIADLFFPAGDNPLKSISLAGAASFSGTVQGSLSAPRVSGQLAAQNLQVNGTHWKVFRTNVDASPAHISLSHADLEPALRGKLTFDASAGLTNWVYSDSSPFQVRLNASQLDLADMAQLSGHPIPATGILNANIDLRGTELNPIGNGSVTLNKATAYGESISSAEINFAGAESAVHGDLTIHAPAGMIRGTFIVHPMQKTYAAELNSSGIQIEKIKAVAAANEDITGVLTLSAKGEGSFDNPQGNAVIEIPKLVAQGQDINDIKLQLEVANHLAVANLTSSAIGTAIRAHCQVNLTGDFLADATLDTHSIPLRPLLAEYLPDEAADIKGETEVHATMNGPLKDWRHLEAHATIPVLKLAYTDAVQLAANAPIHVDFKDGVLNIARSTISGTDTNLRFQGTIPAGTKAPTSLQLEGTVNLHLAQLFSPDLRSSGELRLHIHSQPGDAGQGFGGNIEIVDANISSVDIPVGLQHANGSLTFSNDRITIASFNGTLGGGTLTAQGGVALRPSARFDVGLTASGVRMLYPQGMRESMDANLRLTGSTRSARLSGTVNVTDLSFTQAFDLSSFIAQFTGGVEAPPSRGFAQSVALNLAVHSANNVNLVSRTVSVGGSANLQVRGTLADPVILGRATLTGGDIVLNNKRFVLTGGTVQFTNPTQTEPNVNLSLTTTIQQYNIRLRFEGPIDQLRTQYTSDPSLPSADIINLLAFGQTTEASAASSTPANQAAQTAVASQVSSQITSRISRIAGISQLSINPVLPNSNSQGQMGANITIQQRVTGNLFITYSTNVASTETQTIQGQYQVTPRVGVSATRDANGGFGVDVLIKKTW